MEELRPGLVMAGHTPAALLVSFEAGPLAVAALAERSSSVEVEVEAETGDGESYSKTIGTRREEGWCVLSPPPVWYTLLEAVE